MYHNILITGICGFIGSNFLDYAFNTNINIVGLDKMSYAANIDNIKNYLNRSNFKFIKGDICDKSLIENILNENNIDTIINFAAESHVDNSINDPSLFITNNVVGTQNLIECARQYWKSNNTKNKKLFLQISTDEVYGQMDLNSLYRSKEDDILNPRSPYSASKAASEHITMAYFHTFNFPVIITRSCNNFGKKQHNEKFIPTIIKCLIKNEKIPVYGDGKNIREWMFVEDNCAAIDFIIKNGEFGEVYNIGSKNSMDNLFLLNLIIKIYEQITGETNKKELISFVTDRLGHDRKYNIDCGKLKSIGWKQPGNKITKQLTETITWYIENVKF